jgi:hypothetical protein
MYLYIKGTVQGEWGVMYLYIKGTVQWEW